ncbi:DNA methylase [Butyrivibrio sp. ob235]|uniref:DNA methyltransferase n=1 Tax=Butyrivibrio sp. ob235 TaxID=1761780 RepID=UPI0008D74EE2|nr:DNA methyltransferase [Butyrivibrio sp. ob235]SEL77799.1 DNA methylase [Butyrivibrio sp. ob235]
MDAFYFLFKLIYIDPPYNTGNDFVYADDYSLSKEEYEFEKGDITEDGVRLIRNTDSNGRFHSDWCSMMYPRLMLARNLLTFDGAIFISIDAYHDDWAFKWSIHARTYDDIRRELSKCIQAYKNSRG